MNNLEYSISVKTEPFDYVSAVYVQERLWACTS